MNKTDLLDQLTDMIISIGDNQKEKRTEYSQLKRKIKAMSDDDFEKWVLTDDAKNLMSGYLGGRGETPRNLEAEVMKKFDKNSPWYGALNPQSDNYWATNNDKTFNDYLKGTAKLLFPEMNDRDALATLLNEMGNISKITDQNQIYDSWAEENPVKAWLTETFNPVATEMAKRGDEEGYTRTYKKELIPNAIDGVQMVGPFIPYIGPALATPTAQGALGALSEGIRQKISHDELGTEYSPADVVKVAALNAVGGKIGDELLGPALNGMKKSGSAAAADGVEALASNPKAIAKNAYESKKELAQLRPNNSYNYPYSKFVNSMEDQIENENAWKLAERAWKYANGEHDVVKAQSLRKVAQNNNIKLPEKIGTIEELESAIVDNGVKQGVWTPDMARECMTAEATQIQSDLIREAMDANPEIKAFFNTQIEKTAHGTGSYPKLAKKHGIDTKTIKTMLPQSKERIMKVLRPSALLMNPYSDEILMDMAPEEKDMKTDIEENPEKYDLQNPRIRYLLGDWRY